MKNKIFISKHTDSVACCRNEWMCYRPAKKNWQIIHKKYFGITHKTVTIIAIQLAELRSTELCVDFFWKFQCWHGWMVGYFFVIYKQQTTRPSCIHIYMFLLSFAVSLFLPFYFSPISHSLTHTFDLMYVL